MEIENEIRNIVKRIVMEEVDNLSVRAVLREKIDKAGFSRDEIREMFTKIADSYFRSAMNGNVETEVRQIFSDKINTRANEELKKITGTEFSSWRGSEKVRDVLIEEMRKKVRDEYSLSVSVTKKEGE